MISAGERKDCTISRLKVNGVTLRVPAITTRLGKQHGRQNKKAYRVDNYQ